MGKYRIAGIIHNASVKESLDLARALVTRYDPAGHWWVSGQDPLPDASSLKADTDLLITIGGDGTILRGVHAAAPHGIPVLGVNMGRVGFMSEIDAADALEGIGWYLDGNARLERRAMLRAHIVDGADGPMDGLNDVVLARGAVIRVIEIATRLDGVSLATYRGDGVVVATATGSTGYCLSLGGPVIDPASDSLLLKPIGAHMSLHGGAVLRRDTVLEMTLRSANPATLSVDGFLDRPLMDGQTVRVGVSPHDTVFLRRHPTNAFWSTLTARLGMQRGAPPRSQRLENDSGTMGHDEPQAAR